MPDQSNDRRSFLHRFAGLALLGGPATVLGTHKAAPAEPWLAGMNGKHKQFFDVGTVVDGKPLARVANFMRTYADMYGLEMREVNALFGAHADGLGFVAGDRLWARLDLGALYEVLDPQSRAPLTRNPFMDEAHGATTFGLAADATVSAMMRQGVRFLACNNSIDSLAKRLAKRGLGTVESLRQEISGGLLPGVMIVPAMLVAGNRAQESGFTYALLS